VTPEVRALIRTMKRANPLWGAPRIHGELLKLGFEIFERTISRLLAKTRQPPSQSWRVFLANHARDLVALDFFTVPTISFRILHAFVVLAHERRRVVYFNLIANSTAFWTGQQMIEAFPEDTAPRYLLRDRDGIYGDEFRERVEAMGIKEMVVPLSTVAGSAASPSEESTYSQFWQCLKLPTGNSAVSVCMVGT